MKQIFILIVTAFLATACSTADDFGSSSGNLSSVSFTINLDFDSPYHTQEPNLVQVTLTNINTGDIYTATSNESGMAYLESMMPGTYNISASRTLSSTEFFDLFGYTPNTSEVIFNAAQGQVIVNANVTATQLTLKTARIGDLVIKQIYYAGSHTTQGASLRDQFVEIYNNSDQIIYADGLYLAQLYGKNNQTVADFTLANGQFDWNKSIGMPLTSTNANTDFVYSDYVIQIPGNGTQYPILPGQSLVIAQNAQNHQSPLVNNEGNPISIANPALTVDLSQSDFEVYLGDWAVSVGKDIYNLDIQNPGVPDVNIAYWGREGYYSGNKDFIIDNPGRDSFVIFRADNFETYSNYSDPSVTTIENNTKFFLQIPTDVILDGVDLQHFNTNSQRPKMLPSDIDASQINCDAAFNSQSVIRKTKATLTNGRIVLEDTNNSASDFVKLAKANPRGFNN